LWHYQIHVTAKQVFKIKFGIHKTVKGEGAFEHSTNMSTSLSMLATPRATDPKTAIDFTLRLVKSARCSRILLINCSLV